MSFGLIINHNLGSMNALSALNQNQNSLQTMLQQLSTGKQINSASDNAAGYAISQKMQSQINGLDQASQNSQDGISLLQTASGALNQTQSILQRMRTLAVQSSNDTNTAQDRQNLQAEVTQLTQQIDTIANTTQFNTKNLLNGGASVGSTITGAAASQIQVLGGTSSTQAGSSVALTAFTTATAASSSATTATYATNSTLLSGASSVTLNGTSFSFTASNTVQNVLDTINNANIGVKANWSATNGISFASTTVGSASNLTVSGVTGDFVGSNTLTAGKDATITATGTPTYTASGNTITIQSGNATGLQFTVSGATGAATINVNSNGGLNLQIGANQNQTMYISIGNMSSSALGVNNLDITSSSNAATAITTIDNSLQTVSLQQAQLGAYQNRLQDSISNVETSSQNLTTAQSGITDTNMASAMANFTKDNVLQQAAISMLAQANQQPQLVLKLLG